MVEPSGCCIIAIAVGIDVVGYIIVRRYILAGVRGSNRRCASSLAITMGAR
ncbi:hypothetical protein KCP76_17930 [Salmonella enterica subsp. enterica serovar Weltevreden]|nr:hypothetical protein KCP76_17930 [Salmonella enterica subsp. enterica serovar Weltevreden]